MKRFNATMVRQFVLAAVVFLAASRDAAAGDATAAARAFADGQQALLEGNYDRAADSFELANSIIPSKEALRSAVRAHAQVDHLARAAMLSEELLARYPADPTSVALANEVLEQAKQKLGRVQVTCKEGCTLSVQGRAASMTRAARHVLFLRPGRQVLKVTFDDESVLRDVTAAIGINLSIDVEAPARKPLTNARPAITSPPPVERRHGLPRIVPLIGLSLTVVGAGVATLSSFDTRAAHEDYVAMPNHQDWLDGRSRQLRTNIMWGATAGLGAITLALAYWTNWHPATEAARIGLTTTARDAMVVLTRPF